MNFLRKYWIELIVFLAIGFVTINDLNPAFTWVNTDSDGPHYTLAAKYLWLSHNTSAPLFLLLGRLFLFIPFGHEAWRFGLLLALSTIVASIVIYKIIRYHLKDNPKARFYAMIASLIYGGSALVISQSTIIDTYAFDTMLALFAYYFALKKQWIKSSVCIGLLWATHTLFAWMAWIPLLIQFKPMRDRVLIFVALLGLLFYLYIPIVVAINHPIDMWNNATIQGWFTGASGVLTMLTGGIAIYDFPKRILDTIGILGVSLGFGFFILVWALWKFRKIEKALFWLTVIPVIYFATNLSAETYVYLMPTIAFGAVLVAIGLSRLRIGWSYVTAVVGIGLLIFNAQFFDIGKNLDPNMSAMKFYNEELPKIADGQIFMGGGWNWAMVYLYNKENDRNIVILSTDTLPSEKYLDQIEAWGIKFVRSKAKEQIDRQFEVALYIAENNPNVWIVKDTDLRTYGAEVVPAKGNEYLLTRWIGHRVQTEWRWKPSPPYSFISGALEVSEWKFVLWSNRSVLHFAFYGLMGYGVVWIFTGMGKKKQKAGEIETIQDKAGREAT